MRKGAQGRINSVELQSHIEGLTFGVYTCIPHACIAIVSAADACALVVKHTHVIDSSL